MAKYLIKASYTAEGTKGLVKEGGSGRRATVQKMVEGLGGKLETFYFTYGETDVVLICDLPDAASAIAISLTVNATGAVHASTTPLISVEDVDAACKKSVGYRAPGS